MCIAGDKGLDAASAHLGPRLAATLFGEAQSRIVVTVPADKREALSAILTGNGVPFEFIGRVSADKTLRFGPIEATDEEIRDAWENGLSRSLGTVTLPDV